MKLIFASNNEHKLHELRAAIGADIDILSLKEAGIFQEIPEPFDTLRENAEVKAETIFQLSRSTNCFSEDTGLEVDSLNGEPGVHSARYAGQPVSTEKNICKLLTALGENSNRSARFRTVICLILNNEKFYFEGVCEGRIVDKVTGLKGFGYDPIFVPQGAEKTFAEMSTDEKNRYSHRKKAADKLIRFLQSKSEYSKHAED